jgi:hypothetical protein
MKNEMPRMGGFTNLYAGFLVGSVVMRWQNRFDPMNHDRGRDSYNASVF